MKSIKKISLIALAISPLTALTFTPSVVRHTNLKQHSFFTHDKKDYINKEYVDIVKELTKKCDIFTDFNSPHDILSKIETGEKQAKETINNCENYIAQEKKHIKKLTNNI